MKNRVKVNKKQKSSFRRKDKNLRKKTLKNYRKKSIAKEKKRQKGGLSKSEVEDIFGKANSFANEYVKKSNKALKKQKGGGLSISNLFAKKSEETKKKEEEYKNQNPENEEKGTTTDGSKENNTKLQEFIDYVIGIKDIDSQEKLDQSDAYKVETLAEKWNSLDEIFKKYFIERKLNVDDIKSWKHKLRSGEKSDLEKLQRAYNELKHIYTATTFDSKKGGKNIDKLTDLMKDFEQDGDDTISNLKTTLENEFVNVSESDSDNEPSRYSKFKDFMSRKKKDPIDPDMSDYDSSTDQKITVDKEKDKYVWIRVNIPKNQSVMVQSDTSGTVDETIKNITQEGSETPSNVDGYVDSPEEKEDDDDKKSKKKEEEKKE